MKDSMCLFLRRLAAASLIGGLALSAPAAWAGDIITVFDVSGTATNETSSAIGSCGASSTCAFSGTLTVDVITGTPTAIDVIFPGLSAFNTDLSAFDDGFPEWAVSADNVSGGQSGESLVLNISTTPPGTLVGLTSASIVNGDVRDAPGNNTIFYGAFAGSVVPPAVPEPATWALMLVGFVGLGFAGCRARAALA